MTFEQKFAEVKKELDKRDPKYLSTNIAVQVTMDDEDCGGTFYVSNIDGEFAVEPYDYWDNTLYINLMSNTLMDMLKGKLDGTDALFRGLVTGEGNLDHGLAILTMPKKKAAAAKKPAAKKTATTKKAAAPKKAAEKKAAPAKKTAEKKAEAPKKAAATTKKAAEKKAAAPKKAATTTKKAAEKKAAPAKKAAEKKPAAKKTAAKK